MAKAYILVLMGILCAKAAGFLRDAVFASAFGTSVASDIYFQIFSIASLVFTAVGSALSTLIIKNINKPQYSKNGGQEKYAAHFMRRISLMLLILTALLYLFAKPLVKLLLPSLTGADFNLAVRVMYIMLPSLLFICVAYMMSGLLQNRRVFFTPSIMSLPYNAVAVLVLLFGVRDIEIISAVTTFGWFLHIVIQLPDFYRKGYRFCLTTKGAFKGGEIKNAYETLFIFISGLMLQLCFVTDKIFASSSQGVVSALSYASNLFITFSGLFVVAMSSVVFPAISQNYEHGEMDYVRELIRYMIKLMVSIFAFYLVAVVFFGDFAVFTIYEHGAFTREDTIRVTGAFIIYSLAIFGYLAQNILNKLFYLAGKYKVTVAGTLIVVLLNALIDYLLVPRFGAYFAAVTTTLLLTAYAVFIAVKLKSIIGNYITKDLMKALGKIALSALMSVAAVYVCERVVPEGVQYEYHIPIFVTAMAIYGVSLLISGVLKDLFTTPLSRVRKG
ncbi:MAG: polysaccharide biosynthesis C-terminal domain-containing protein [Clostridia bacterium]|nr:polysaccharide biosynthesis C-terminal domain-containing protein [Clostridia bacterium]